MLLVPSMHCNCQLSIIEQFGVFNSLQSLLVRSFMGCESHRLELRASSVECELIFENKRLLYECSGIKKSDNSSHGLTSVSIPHIEMGFVVQPAVNQDWH